MIKIVLLGLIPRLDLFLAPIFSNVSHNMTTRIDSNQFFLNQHWQGRRSLSKGGYFYGLSIAQENAQFLDGARVLLSRFYSGLSAEFEKEKKFEYWQVDIGCSLSIKANATEFLMPKCLRIFEYFFHVYVCVICKIVWHFCQKSLWILCSAKEILCFLEKVQLWYPTKYVLRNGVSWIFEKVVQIQNSGNPWLFVWKWRYWLSLVAFNHKWLRYQSSLSKN